MTSAQTSAPIHRRILEARPTPPPDLAAILTGIAAKTTPRNARNRRTPRSPAARPTDDQLLDAALVVFAEHGYENASMDAIAAQADCTKVTVYAHFGTKEGLHDALLDRELAVIRDELFASYDRAATQPAATAIATTVEGFIDYAAAHPLGMTWLFGKANASLTPKGQAQFDVMVGRLAALIESSPQGSARLKREAALVATMSLTAVISAAHRALVAGEDPRALIEVASAYIASAHRGI